MYYAIFNFIEQLFVQNQDALMAIPTEIKTILMIALGIWAVTALSKGAIKMLKYIALAVVIYACCTYFGIL